MYPKPLNPTTQVWNRIMFQVAFRGVLHIWSAGSIPGQSILDLWWTAPHCDRVSSNYFGFPQPALFYQCYTHTHTHTHTHTLTLLICTSHQIFAWSSEGDWNWQDMWRVWKTEVYTGIWRIGRKARGRFEGIGGGGRIILKFIFKKWNGGRHGLGLYSSWEGQLAGSCGHGNESLGSVKCEKYINYIRKN
jgi:hypothetical protein